MFFFIVETLEKFQYTLNNLTTENAKNKST